MHTKILFVAIVGLSTAVKAAGASFRSPIVGALERRQQRGAQGGKSSGGQGSGNNGGNQGGNQGGNGGDDGDLALSPDLVQTASQDDGNNPGADGQAASATSTNNFINFCKGKTLTNGKQIKQGSCNGIPMGNIPASDRMVSSVFVNPQNGANLAANQDFTIQVQMINFKPGSFTNATSNYYSAPQDLDAQGNIMGHTHVTIQDTGEGLNPKTPLDPTRFVFFKGINDAGNNRGLLSAHVTGGLPAGNYRLCSMSAASNHQPVMMPVAQRGAQDDCVRFTVGGSGGNGGNGNVTGDDGGRGQGAPQGAPQGGRQGGRQGGQPGAGAENNAQLPGTEGGKQGEVQNGNQRGGQADVQDGGQTGGQQGGQTGGQRTGRQGGQQAATQSEGASASSADDAAAGDNEASVQKYVK